MKVLLVQPKAPPSFWTCSEAEGITGCRSYMQNIALPTLAALAPDDVDVTIVDDASEPIDYEAAWDLVGVTGYITHRTRMLEIADEFRRRGRLVAIGGPYASLSPASVRAHADVLFVGEAEETWPQFLQDFRAGAWRSEYHAPAAIDLRRSPVPAIGKLGPRYVMGVVQTSRGCPFECEFCDVIVYLGRKQRHKEPARVVAELEQLYQAGYRHVFLADDNFTVNRKRCADIMQAVRAWSRDLAEPMFFTTQLSIDIAREADTELLDLCAEAGLREAFIGIETPDHDALREVKKRQNVRSDLVADIHRVQSRGLAVWAGMISGFDADTKDSFERQYLFVQRSGILIAALSLLVAPEGTPLAKRLQAEGRLLSAPSDLFIDTNIVPKRMTREELFAGIRWLWNRLYAPDAFLARIAVFAEHAPLKKRTREVAPVSAYYWQRLFDEYERMGPEFRTLPRRAIKLFRGRDSSLLGGALAYYNHIIGLLRRWGVWDPRLAELPAPAFDAPAGPDLSHAAASAAH